MSLIAPALVLGAVWWPDFNHYYVRTPSIPAESVDSGRRVPDDSLLEELASITPGFGLVPRTLGDGDLIAGAESLLRGQPDSSGRRDSRGTVLFSADDIDRGPGSRQLVLAGLTQVDLLLRAYWHTRDDRYLFGARDMILAWAGYERRAWLPKGLLWNDHALAGRIPVLAAFWFAYRHHPSYDAVVARTLFEFLARTGSMLADPAHFTFSTNHGVMQNLALWHLYLAFPSLPHAARYRDTALARLRQQMTFYVNTEGVVLEHSAGYHLFGVELMGMAMRYLALMQIPPPDDWAEKYRRAALVYAHLRLPDGFLPLIGDTGNQPDPLGPLVTTIGLGGRAQALRYDPSWRPTEAHSLYPVAGYSIWWGGLDHWPSVQRLSQTVAAWSLFPGHGHKHADEPSVSLWAAGHLWWSNVGYWSYDHPGRSPAQSWDGSNAPHLVGERANSLRSSRLVSSGWSPALAAIHLERRGPGSYLVHRQLVHLDPNIWIVVDHTTGPAQDLSRTQWTTSPTIRLAPGDRPNSYTLRPAGSPLSMSVQLLTSSGATTRQVQGSVEPFAGWQVVASRGTPAPALVIDQPARDSWAIAVWCLNTDSPAGVACPDRADAEFTDEDRWVLSWRTPAALLTLRRSHGVIRVAGDGAPSYSEALSLEAPADLAPKIEELRSAYARVASQYPRFRDLTRYRFRVSFAILGLLVAQEVLFALPTPIRRYRAAFRALATLAWALLGGWLTLVYFR